MEQCRALTSLGKKTILKEGKVWQLVCSAGAAP